MKEPFRK